MTASGGEWATGSGQPEPGTRGAASAREHCQAGDQLLCEGREEAAEAEYRRAVALDPSLTEAHHRLAVALYKRGEFAEARAAAERATELSPDNVDAWFTLGLIRKDARDSRAAIAGFDRALDLQPDHLPALHYRSRVLYQTGAAPEAVVGLRRAAELAPAAADIAHDLAVAHVACRNWHEAEQWFGRCIELEPGNAETYYELGQAHEQDVTTPDADAEAAYLRAVELNPRHLPALFRLAVLWARRRRTDPEARARALNELRQMARRDDLVSLFPDAHLVHYLLGAVLDDDGEAADEAAEAYRKCLELQPRFAPAHNNLGVIALERRDLPAAAEHFKQAVLCDPHCDSAYHNLCRIWYDQPHELADRQLADFVDAAPHEAPRILSRMMGHLVDAARSDAYASSYDRVHEIKNLIGVLGARLRKTLAGCDCPQASEVRDLLDLQARAFEAIRGYLSAIQSVPTVHETVDCGEVLEKALRQLVVVKPAGVSTEKAVSPGLPSLSGDRRRLTQLFQNLIANAFEAMPDGGVLRVSAVSFGPEEARSGNVRRGLRIVFEDTGRGMTEEERRRACDPGYTTKDSGSGYGLAVAAQAAREHGGTLTLDRSDSGGTRVVVELPERPQPEDAADRLRLRPIMFEDWRRLICSEIEPIQPTNGSVPHSEEVP